LFHEPFGKAIEQVMAVGGSALLMMHSDLNVTQPALKVMRAHYQGPIGAYPNAGYWQRPQWAFVDQVTPEAYLAEATQWVQLGGQIVGGCCGIGPDHIRALRQGLSN
jgi:homocysteine S-methyltransferase